MRLKGLYVLLRMLWPDRNVPESQTLEQRADAALGQHDAEPPLDARREILAAPPDHAILREIGAGTGRHFRLLLGRELRDAARRLAIRQSPEPFGIVAVNPVAQRLTATSPGRLYPRPFLQDQRQGQHPPGRFDAPCPLCATTQIIRTQIQSRDRNTLSHR